MTQLFIITHIHIWLASPKRTQRKARTQPLVAVALPISNINGAMGNPTRLADRLDRMVILNKDQPITGLKIVSDL